MRNTIIVILSVLPLFSTLSQVVDPQNVSVNFSVSNMGFRTVEGSLSTSEALLVFDVDNLDTSSFQVTIDATSIDTDNKKRDEHLRKDDFFHVEKHPRISFKSSKIEYVDGNEYSVVGELSIKAISKNVTIPFTHSKSNGTSVLSGEFMVLRKDFDLGSGYGKFMIGEDVTMTIKANIPLP